ncbi:MAG TPA: TetR/AcrR family transcriptional regulator [Solirubrobacterales bacterium]|nr:TetR/AcrR family transcriptional regulator [Solirubrobacterales bacterium]
MAASTKTEPRRRVPAAERRDALIEAAVHHFGHGGLHGTRVSSIAADVGVAQPYVFSLFPTKRDLFLAAVGRCFEKVGALFEAAGEEFDRGGPREPDEDKLNAIGHSYMDAIADNPDLLLLQLQAYAACGDDEEIQTAVRREYAQLVEVCRRISGIDDDERLDGFFQAGMWCNVAAALGVPDFSVDSGWVDEALKEER